MSGGLPSFREINPGKGSESTHHPKLLDAAVVNAGGPFDEERIRKVAEEMEGVGRLSLIDARGELADPEKLHRLISGFPKLHFFLPHETRGTGACLNLFFEESEATYLLLLSSSLVPLRFEMNACVSYLQEDSRRFSLSPFIHRDGGLVETLFELEGRASGEMEVSRKAARDGAPTLAPYGITALFDREKVVSLGGFDEAYADVGVMGIDLYYRAYAMGMSAHVFGGLEWNEENQNREEMFSRPELTFFKIKNFSKLPTAASPLIFVLGAFFRLRFDLIPRYFHFYRQRRRVDETRVVDDEGIFQVFTKSAA